MALPDPPFQPTSPNVQIKVNLDEWTNGTQTGNPAVYFTQEILQWYINKAVQQPDGTYRIALGTPPIEIVFVPS